MWGADDVQFGRALGRLRWENIVAESAMVSTLARPSCRPENAPADGSRYIEIISCQDDAEPTMASFMKRLAIKVS